MTASRSSALCCTARAGGVRIDVGASCTARLGGVARCASCWSCPTCAPAIRQKKGERIDAGCRLHLANGGGIEFLTLTARHSLSDALGDRLEVMLQALRHLLKGSGWTRRRDRLGYVGSIRSVEITWSKHGNGWHPHLHVLLFFDRPLTDAERADFTSWLFSRWAAHLTALGLGSITRRYGIDTRPITTQEGIGEYLTAIDGGWTPGLELARGDAKRTGDTPFDLLVRMVETNAPKWLTLWLEYEHATFGRAAIRWSPGLAKRIGLKDKEQSDAQLVDAADVFDGPTLFRAWYVARVWNRINAEGRAADVQRQVEEVAAVWLFVCAMGGVIPRALDQPGGGEENGKAPPSRTLHHLRAVDLRTGSRRRDLALERGRDPA